MGKAIAKSARPSVVEAEVNRIKKFLAEQIQPQHSKEEYIEIIDALREELAEA